MIPRFTAPELEIFLETSGKIALDIFAASVADAAETNELKRMINCHTLSTL